jgi:hypothetical protein
MSKKRKKRRRKKKRRSRMRINACVCFYAWFGLRDDAGAS